MSVVGYDDDKRQFKVQNSWHTTWSDRGFGYISYDWMENYSWSSRAASRLQQLAEEAKRFKS